jgi:sec-independent protein translocase protein TatA
MLGLTPAHLLLILIIALIVVGPGKLPEVGAAMGKTIREFQKASSGAQETAPGAAAQPAPQLQAPQWQVQPLSWPPLAAPTASLALDNQAQPEPGQTASSAVARQPSPDTHAG